MDPLFELLGDSPAIVSLRQQVRQILKATRATRRPAPLLVAGETGTGKGLLTRAVHRASSRAGGPFVEVNCAAIPEHLLEAELFGFERGAFTDARHAKPGLFQLAHRGILFLDEIVLLPESLQAKLLKVLDNGAVRRLGATTPEKVDVWIVAATNEDLDAARQDRRLREDLYHRLAVLALDVPPLRARGSDVILLAEHFLSAVCADYGLPARTLAAEARAALLAYRWPGNVRELSNVLERSALLSEASVITAAALALPAPADGAEARVPAPATPSRAARSSRDRMRAHLLEVLGETGWNISRTAVLMGVARNTVTARIARFGLTRGNGAGAAPPPTGWAGHLRPPASAASSQPGGTSPEDSSASGKPGATPLIVRGAVARGHWVRRHVALLRADVEAAGGPDDPNETGRLLDRIVTKVQSFGGRVEDLGVTTVLGVFGVEPIEDAPVRASLAAMAILTAARHDRSVGIVTSAVGLAVHVHEVTVSDGASGARIDAHGKHAAWSALEALIRRGYRDAILVSEGAAPLLERRFELAGVTAVSDDGVRAYRLVRREATGFGLGGRPLAPLVGRERELSVLLERMADVEAGHGQVVGILGEPGVGKSRVVLELTRADATRGWQVLSVGGLSYGTTTPFLVTSELLRRVFGIEDTDNPARLEARVVATIRTDHPELEADLPPLLALLDMSVVDGAWGRLDARQRHQRILDAVRRLLLAGSRRQPLLLVIEDVHWIDAGTQAVLDALVESLQGARIVLLVTYRPEYRHGWGSKTYYHQVRVDPLSPASADTLLRWLLGSDASLHPLVPRLHELARGNPFFLEETVRALAETHAVIGERGAYRLARALDTIRMPASVEAVLASRIEQLPADCRELLQWAAVIGTHVPAPLLRVVVAGPEELIRRGLACLAAAELLHETRVAPDPGYAFKHALTHEVAYGSLLPEQRCLVHARVVEAIEQTYRDRLAEHVEQLAHHAVRGGMPEKAVDYLRQAGQRAAARSALPEARAWLEQALGVLHALPASPPTLEQAFEIRFELRPVLSVLGEVRETLELLRQAEALAAQLNDDRRRGQVYALLTNIHSQLGELEEAVATGTRALEIAGRLQDVSLRILASTYLEQAHNYRGEHERAVALAADNLAALPAGSMHERFGLPVPASVYDRWALVPSLAELGRFTDAAKHDVEAIKLAEPTQHAYTIGGTYLNAGALRLSRGEWSEARSYYERATAVLRTGNVVLPLPLAVAGAAWALGELGEAGDAHDRVLEAERLLEHVAASRNVMVRGWAYWALGRACLALGRLEDAQRLADLAVESLPSDSGLVVHVWHLLGDIAMHPDRLDVERGKQLYRHALRLGKPRGMRPLIAHCHFGLGTLCRRTGDHAKAEEHLTTAAHLYREMELRFWLERAEAALVPFRRGEEASGPDSRHAGESM